MRNLLLVASAVLSLAGGAAQAARTTDDPGDFLPSFAGPNDNDLDVIFFSATYDAGAMAFNLKATMADDINPARAGLYVIGVNTGTGAIAPFGDIGNGNVIFDHVFVVLKTGDALLDGVTPIAAASISGADLSLVVPLSLIPSTGFKPNQYAFNIWPRNGFDPTDNSQISDFAPNNANLAAVPEPALWGAMILGFGFAGGALRRRRVCEARPSLA